MNDEKLSEPILLRLPVSMNRRLSQAVKRNSIARQSIIRSGLQRELERLEQQASPVTSKEAKTIEAFKKVTGSTDITPVLAAAMRDYVEREAKAPYIGRPAPIIDTTGISIRKTA